MKRKTVEADENTDESEGRHAPRSVSGRDVGVAVTPSKLKIELPWATIFKVFAAILLAIAAGKLWPLFLLVFLALLIAVTLHPVLEWLESKKVKRWVSLLLVIGTLLTVLGLGIALIIPQLIEQSGTFIKGLPALRDEILSQFSSEGPLRPTIERVLTKPEWFEDGKFIAMGGMALMGISQFFLMLVISIYLLIDGKSIFEWTLAFFSPSSRTKMRTTSEEISQVIFRYVWGQAVTSALVAVFAYVVLSILKVPGALMLAVVAGVCDVLPILGFFLYVAPSCLLALSVSPRTSLIVLGLFVFYQALESYLIVPRIYGMSLRLSTLTVLLGLLAGTLLAGIPGALAALPVVASYSVIERIWLKPFLGEGVAEKHEKQKDKEFGEKA